MLDAFVPDPARHAGVRADADASWADRGHRAEELYPEALATLQRARRPLSARRASPITSHGSATGPRRQGFAELIGAWAISAEVGAEKPDPALFRSLLREAGTTADRVAMVGDRLDRDIAPAKALGMRTVWVLRNEAPDDPTPEQLAVPDAVVHSLEALPGILERF